MAVWRQAHRASTATRSRPSCSCILAARARARCASADAPPAPVARGALQREAPTHSPASPAGRRRPRPRRSTAPTGPCARATTRRAAGARRARCSCSSTAAASLLGDLDTHDAPCRMLCRHGGMHVLAVDYRLAPEHPFPAAVDDARAAFAGRARNAAKLGADPTRVGIGGDSAGANLSAVVAQLGRARRRARAGVQMLVYPAVDRPGVPVARALRGGLLPRAARRSSGSTSSTPATVGGTIADPRARPLTRRVLAGLAAGARRHRAGFDPLRDEGEAYAAGARRGGRHRRYAASTRQSTASSTWSA